MGIGKGRGEWKGGERKIWTEILTFDLTPLPHLLIDGPAADSYSRDLFRFLYFDLLFL